MIIFWPMTQQGNFLFNSLECKYIYKQPIFLKYFLYSFIKNTEVRREQKPLSLITNLSCEMVHTPLRMRLILEEKTKWL